MILKFLHYRTLQINHWETHSGETWCLLGGNASGKGLLATLLTGKEKPEKGEIIDLPAPTRWASFERQQEIYERELKNDETDYLDRLDPGTTSLEMLLQSGCSNSEALELSHKMHIEEILERGYRLLSSGEARKVLLLKEILSRPELLILDEPFEGLDVQSRSELIELTQKLVDSGQKLLFLVNRIDDIPNFATHLGLIQRGQLVESGPKENVIQKPEFKQIVELDQAFVPELPPPPVETSDSFNTIVRIRNCSVKYEETIQFDGFNWELKSGEHTLITGPNGAGKSTLLQLLSGDHPQCYQNDINIFGYQRGTGESIWDIKKHIGIVSASLHRDYRAPGNTLTTVVSGFYDSIGLYQQATPAQRQLALKWLEIMGLRDQANVFFRQLSWGQQRLALIARGLIKQPPLLILDEPTQGLDDLNRHLVLAFIEKLAGLKYTTLLFVSHRQDEHLSLFKQRVEFSPSNRDGVQFELGLIQDLNTSH